MPAPVAWPADVPQDTIAGTFREEKDRNVVSFAPDIGPPLERRRSSLTTSSISFEAMLTIDQWKVLERFHDVDLACVAPFMRKHPRTGADIICTFLQPPAPRESGPGFVRAVLSLKVIP